MRYLACFFLLITAIESCCQKIFPTIQVSQGLGSILQDIDVSLADSPSSLETTYVSKFGGGLDIHWQRKKGHSWSIGVDVVNHAKHVRFAYYNPQLPEGLGYFQELLSHRTIYPHIGFQMHQGEWALGIDVGLMDQVGFAGRNRSQELTRYDLFGRFSVNSQGEISEEIGGYGYSFRGVDKGFDVFAASLSVGYRITEDVHLHLRCFYRRFPHSMISYELFEFRETEELPEGTPINLQDYRTERVWVNQDNLELNLMLSYSMAGLLRNMKK